MEELEQYDIRAEGPHIIIPTLGRSGAWYERIRCSGGCHPRYYSPPGMPDHLYNPLGLGPHSDVVWIAEGELDCLSLVVSGAPAVALLGAAKFQIAWKHLFTGTEIHVALDADEAGDQASEKLIALFEPGQAWRFNPATAFAKPYGDLNEAFAADRHEFERVVKEW